ncbi:hypothetical protein Daura_39190 [Dactylosporangium aurantiacum]|uniref:Uncharacterized protein n=1 Tax=Dactylosporangium aurantiacum TaxID=35754 RepID=A0A9Q9ICF2_9ACTN|nr:hypothetical protein [Dactylosporangium aurantiacum]MDG6101551.1 hypothetical protein [Dactylosporangium aurantiacum]UWZ52611.1 hypothetical protein Daura_39190 [Dactylosporangium aurantiacum]
MALEPHPTIDPPGVELREPRDRHGRGGALWLSLDAAATLAASMGHDGPEGDLLGRLARAAGGSTRDGLVPCCVRAGVPFDARWHDGRRTTSVHGGHLFLVTEEDGCRGVLLLEFRDSTAPSFGFGSARCTTTRPPAGTPSRSTRPGGRSSCSDGPGWTVVTPRRPPSPRCGPGSRPASSARTCRPAATATSSSAGSSRRACPAASAGAPACTRCCGPATCSSPCGSGSGRARRRSASRRSTAPARTATSATSTLPRQAARDLVLGWLAGAGVAGRATGFARTERLLRVHRATTDCVSHWISGD